MDHLRELVEFTSVRNRVSYLMASLVLDLGFIFEAPMLLPLKNRHHIFGGCSSRQSRHV